MGSDFYELTWEVLIGSCIMARRPLVASHNNVIQNPRGE
jgi:hypothetical protein